MTFCTNVGFVWVNCRLCTKTQLTVKVFTPVHGPNRSDPKRRFGFNAEPEIIGEITFYRFTRFLHSSSLNSFS